MRKNGLDGSRRRFTSTVALVTSSYAGTSNVMSAEWSLRVSLDPYLVAVFIGYERGSYGLISSSGEFGLNYCSDDQVQLSHIAGRHSISNGEDKWKMADFSTFSGTVIGAPLIDGCIMNLECRVIDEFTTGDHAEFVGEVVNAYYDEEKKPLVYHGGEYFGLGEHLRKPGR